MGTVYYVIRRFTGRLLVPMVLHGAWDGPLFSGDFSGEDAPAVTSLLLYVAIIVGFVGLVKIRREHPEAVQPAPRSELTEA